MVTSTSFASLVVGPRWPLWFTLTPAPGLVGDVCGRIWWYSPRLHRWCTLFQIHSCTFIHASVGRMGGRWRGAGRFPNDVTAQVVSPKGTCSPNAVFTAPCPDMDAAMSKQLVQTEDQLSDRERGSEGGWEERRHKAATQRNGQAGQSASPCANSRAPGAVYGWGAPVARDM